MGKFDDRESFKPEPVEPDPYRDLFAGLTAFEAVVLQAEIDEAERTCR